MLYRWTVFLSGFWLFAGLAAAKPDPDIFDGSDYPIPEMAEQDLLAQLMDGLLRQAEDAERVASRDGSESGSDDADAGAASPARNPTQVAGAEGASPGGTPRRTEPVTIGNPDLAIQRDQTAVGGQLGDPVQRTTTRGGVAGSGPDRSRTPTGSASGGALPTDL